MPATILCCRLCKILTLPLVEVCCCRVSMRRFRLRSSALRTGCLAAGLNNAFDAAPEATVTALLCTPTWLLRVGKGKVMFALHAVRSLAEPSTNGLACFSRLGLRLSNILTRALPFRRGKYRSFWLLSLLLISRSNNTRAVYARLAAGLSARKSRAIADKGSSDQRNRWHLRRHSWQSCKAAYMELCCGVGGAWLWVVWHSCSLDSLAPCGATRKTHVLSCAGLIKAQLLYDWQLRHILGRMNRTIFWLSRWVIAARTIIVLQYQGVCVMAKDWKTI